MSEPDLLKGHSTICSDSIDGRALERWVERLRLGCLTNPHVGIHAMPTIRSGRYGKNWYHVQISRQTSLFRECRKKLLFAALTLIFTAVDITCSP